MKTCFNLLSFCLPGALSAALLLATASAPAQMTANWYGTVNTDWNDAGNWDLGVPAEGTNAAISLGTTVDYNAAMVATSFAGLNLQNAGTVLNVNAAGFNLDSGGATGLPLVLGTSTALNLGAAGVLITLNTVNAGSMNLGVNGNNAGASFVIDGGTATFDKLVTVQGTGSRLILKSGTLNCNGNSRVNDTSNDGAQRLVVNGGTANLGNFSVYRSTSSGGLIISNGLVTANNVQIGIGNARSYGQIYGGKLTVSGTMTVHDSVNVSTSTDRRTQFLQRGGEVEVTGVGGLIIANQYAGNASRVGGIYDITAGTLTTEKLTLLRDNTLTNVSARLNGGAATIYLGSGGLEVNLGGNLATATIALTNTTFGAAAAWSSTADIPLNSGTITFKAADRFGAAKDITLYGRLTGSAHLAKTGAGTLTLHATNTCSGNTLVHDGTLVLGATGSLLNSPALSVAAGASFDASAPGGLAVGAGKTVSGSGTVLGAVALGAGTLVPGAVGQAGTLALANGLVATGGGTVRLDLGGDPAGVTETNDLLRITGDLDLTGVTVLQVNPLATLPPAAVYKLVEYTGTLNGGLANFQLAGAAGTLTNWPGAIGLITEVVRGPTNVVWVGNAAANYWDTLVSTNWLNAGVLDKFVTGDAVRFDATGAANPQVSVVGVVAPASVTVDAATDYAFIGAGVISGAGGLTKTNAGTLTILTANDYLGPTLIGQGVVEVSKLAASGAPSGIGAAGSDPANLVFHSTTLRYLGGNASTDRGATLNDTGATIEVASSTNTLTLSGTFAGAGGLTKGGPGTLNLAGNGAYEGVTTLGSGTVQLSTATTAIGTNTIKFAGGTLRLAISGQPVYANALEIAAESSLISAGGNNNILSGLWSGTAALNVSIASGGVLTINRAFEAGFTGTIALGGSAGLFRLNAGGSDPCKGSPYATFDLGTGTAALVNRNGSSYGTLEYFLGALAGGPNTQLRGSENTGAGNTYVIGDKNLNTTFAGSIRNGAGGASAVVSLAKSGTGTLTLTGTNTYGGVTTISNGVLALAEFGSIDGSTNIQITAGTALDVSARADGTLHLGSGRGFSGEGEVRGSVLSGGIISPGGDVVIFSPLTITNTLTLAGSSVVICDLDPFTPTNDVVRVGGTLTYGGTLRLRASGIPTVGQSFKLFDAPAYSGAVATVVSDYDLSFSGLAWDMSQLAVDGTVKVVPLVPAIGQITIADGTLTLAGSQGMPGGSYRVLVSANAALPVAQWVPVATNYFNFDGTFTYSDTVNPAQPVLFYLIASP
jgi:fibronectin-binding autotransporter adhesin